MESGKSNLCAFFFSSEINSPKPKTEQNKNDSNMFTQCKMLGSAYDFLWNDNQHKYSTQWDSKKINRIPKSRNYFTKIAISHEKNHIISNLLPIKKNYVTSEFKAVKILRIYRTDVASSIEVNIKLDFHFTCTADAKLLKMNFKKKTTKSN